MNTPPKCPRKELHHYVSEWIQRGFCDPHGDLHAFRLDNGKRFRTGPRRLYARHNQNTVWSDEDAGTLLAYSESSYRYLDRGAAARLKAIRDAARQAAWSVNVTGVCGITAEITSWIRAAVLMQYTRTATVFRDWSAIAEERGLNAVQRRVVEVAAAVRRPKRMEAVLCEWSPIICRSAPQSPFILGDDIVLFGLPTSLPTAQKRPQEVPFVGIPVDQHTLIGFTEPGCQRFSGDSGNAEVVQLSNAVVDEVCTRIATKAITIAASSVVRSELFGNPEYKRRQGQEPAMNYATG